MLLEATKWVLSEVERTTGKPVHVQEDPSIMGIATVNIARGDLPMHIVRYKPLGSTPADYWICWQCGFLLRLYELPSGERFDIVSADAGEKEMAQLLAQSPAAESLKPMADFFLSNLIIQLRSGPIGMRIDRWIAESLPELRELQKAGARKQLNDNVQGLNVPNRAVIPKKIFTANATMNSAFAQFWARELSEPSLALPYRLAGFDKDGQRLMALIDELSATPESDRTLVNGWAEILGLESWYRWKPHR